jgi:hypothetical protein
MKRLEFINKIEKKAGLSEGSDTLLCNLNSANGTTVIDFQPADDALVMEMVVLVAREHDYFALIDDVF